MELKNIPISLRHLVDLVCEWGINDDGYRDEKIEESSSIELRQFIDCVDEKIIAEMNFWLSDEAEIKKSSNEYIDYTCFLMAFEYAQAVLNSRDKNYQQ